MDGIVKLYAMRRFPEILMAVFTFLKQNIVQMLKYFGICVVPAAILFSWSLLNYMKNMHRSGKSGAAEILLCIFSFAFIVVVITTLYTLIKLYRERDGNLSALQTNDFFAAFVPCLKKTAIIQVAWIVVYYLLMQLFTTLIEGGIIGILILQAIIVCLLPLYMVLPVFFFEDKKLDQSLTKGWRIGWNTWSNTYGLTSFVGMVASVLVGVVFYLLSEIFSDVSFNRPTELSTVLMMSLVMIVLAFGIQIIVLAHAFQYGHAAADDPKDPLQE